MRRGSPSAGCHKRPLYRGILRDMMRAAFQMRPYRDQNRQFGRRSNTTNASVRYVPQEPHRPLAREDLGFHPAWSTSILANVERVMWALVSCRAELGHR